VAVVKVKGGGGRFGGAKEKMETVDWGPLLEEMTETVDWEPPPLAGIVANGRLGSMPGRVSLGALNPISSHATVSSNTPSITNFLNSLEAHHLRLLEPE
jgi:hypothetical protein